MAKAFSYRTPIGGYLYTYTLYPHTQCQVQVFIHRKPLKLSPGGGLRLYKEEKILGLTNRHAVRRAHRWAVRYLDVLLREHRDQEALDQAIEEINPAEVVGDRVGEVVEPADTRLSKSRG